VPSVVTPGEWNFLLNPLHPDFPKVQPGAASPFRPDPRLIR
jgi:RES domain-containing protein